MVFAQLASGPLSWPALRNASDLTLPMSLTKSRIEQAYRVARYWSRNGLARAAASFIAARGKRLKRLLAGNHSHLEDVSGQQSCCGVGGYVNRSVVSRPSDREARFRTRHDRGAGRGLRTECQLGSRAINACPRALYIRFHRESLTQSFLLELIFLLLLALFQVNPPLTCA